eukprot:1158925-Pelagomonas_calceolata.AAC.3
MDECSLIWHNKWVQHGVSSFFGGSGHSTGGERGEGITRWVKEATVTLGGGFKPGRLAGRLVAA